MHSDLRGTRVNPRTARPRGYIDASKNKVLAHTDLQGIIEELTTYEDAFSSSNRFVLDINRRAYEPSQTWKTTTFTSRSATQDSYTVISRNGGVATGDSATLEMKERKRLKEDQHARNSEAWKRRNGVDTDFDAFGGYEVCVFLALYLPS